MKKLLYYILAIFFLVALILFINAPAEAQQRHMMSPQAREHAKLQKSLSREAVLKRLSAQELVIAKENRRLAKNKPTLEEKKQKRHRRRVAKIEEHTAAIKAKKSN